MWAEHRGGQGSQGVWEAASGTGSGRSELPQHSLAQQRRRRHGWRRPAPACLLALAVAACTSYSAWRFAASLNGGAGLRLYRSASAGIGNGGGPANSPPCPLCTAAAAAAGDQAPKPSDGQQQLEDPGLTKDPALQARQPLDVIGMAVKPTCVNRAAIQALRRHLEPRGIYVVTQTARQCVAFRSWGHNVHCHLQDGLLPGVTKASVGEGLNARFGVEAGREFRGRHLAGWYLQQFLKLGAAGALPGLSEHFLIWDLDMVPLRPLPLLTRVDPSDATGGSDMQALVNIGGLPVMEYRAAYETLFGQQLELAPDGTTLVSHMMVVYKPFMEAFLAEIANVTAPAPALAWTSRILDVLPRQHLDLGFSEYASYISWVRQRHPGAQRLAEAQTWRRYGPGGEAALVAAAAAAPGGLCCPSDQQLKEAAQQGLEYCGFDIGHVPQCRYTDAAHADAYGVELLPE